VHDPDFQGPIQDVGSHRRGQELRTVLELMIPKVLSVEELISAASEGSHVLERLVSICRGSRVSYLEYRVGSDGRPGHAPSQSGDGLTLDVSTHW
jgi:hypothetical protein